MNQKIIIKIDVGNMTMKEAEAILRLVTGYPTKPPSLWSEILGVMGVAGSFDLFL